MSQVAVVDRSGIIIAISEAWADFARTRCDTDWQLARTGVGVNFLDVCRPTARTNPRSGPASSISSTAASGSSTATALRIPGPGGVVRHERHPPGDGRFMAR